MLDASRTGMGLQSAGKDIEQAHAARLRIGETAQGNQGDDDVNQLNAVDAIFHLPCLYSLRFFSNPALLMNNTTGKVVSKIKTKIQLL